MLNASSFDRTQMRRSTAMSLGLTLAVALGSLVAIAVAWAGEPVHAAEAAPEPPSYPDGYSVEWSTPSANSSGSMPLGNGDLGINLWVEAGGDLFVYLSKTDAWSECGRLLKLGRVRLALSPNPFAKGLPFRQELRLSDGTLRIDAGLPGRRVAILVYVDANRPVVRFVLSSEEPIGLEASLEPWRTAPHALQGDELFSCWHMQGVDRAGLPIEVIETPDTILDDRSKRIAWYHRNETSVWGLGLRHQGLGAFAEEAEDPLLHLTFGGLLEGDGLERVGRLALRSSEPKRTHRVNVHALTARTPKAEEWVRLLEGSQARNNAEEATAAFHAHSEWWASFWNRSRVEVLRAEGEAKGIATNALPLRLGADSQGGSRFRGLFQRARVWRRALTPQEVARFGADPTFEPEGALREGLVGDWILADTADGIVKNRAGGSSGAAQGLDARVVGKLETGELDGRKGARFDGSGYLEVASDPRLDMESALTLEAWIAPEALGSEGARIIDKSQVGTSNGYLLDTFPGNSLRVIAEPEPFGHEAKLPPGRWVHVAATVDSATGRRVLFVGGAALAKSGPVLDDLPHAINQAWVLQRWMQASAGRGAYPIKFNGSIFTVEPRWVDGKPYDADYRAWGGDYWWQNTRLPYWSMLASGDHDLMRPVFEMYFRQIPLARHRTRAWTGAEGVWFGETVSFWGMYSNGDYGWNREGKPVGLMDNAYIRHIWQVGLELGFLMLDWFDATQDRSFLDERAIPLISEVLRYFETRFPRDPDGRIRIEPAQACETWQDSTNPLPEVAGLHAVVTRLLALPDGFLAPEMRRRLEDLRKILPEIPLGEDGGKRFVLPGQRFEALGNIENPELYSVFPYRLYGVGKPDLELALATFDRRRVRSSHGWHQDAIQAAILGRAEEAAAMLRKNVASKHTGSRFPGFYGPNYDWVPDQDHAANILSTIQAMLLQADQGKIYLLPAWPKGWDARFRLHAPERTIVEAEVRGGEVRSLRVEPEARRKDVIIVPRGK